jgi:multidrug efflux pump subunit AcrB
LLFAFGLAIFLVYLVMASQFESLLHPFVIMFSVPLAIVGAVLALWLSRSPVSVVVFIGLILLVGIVVKNAIVLIDKVNQLREEGVAKRDAICQGAESRLRPIAMTTLCTLFGFAPLAFFGGDGAEVRAPMAITVIGGLAVSTLLTLVVIPIMYDRLDRKSDAAYKARGDAARAAAAKAAGRGDGEGAARMTLAELSLRRPVTAVMFFVSMVVIGLIASFRLPLEQFPEVNVPFLMINFPYPGSTPQEVERSIARPAERGAVHAAGHQGAELHLGAPTAPT